MMDEKVKEDFLAKWPQNKRATIMNQFLGAIRHGETTFDGMMEWLVADGVRRLRSPYADAATVEAQRLLISIQADPDTQAMCEYCLWWESLSSDEKHRIRLERGGDYAKQVMATQPPSDKQLEYLKGLGCFDVPKSKAEASDWIERFKNK